MMQRQELKKAYFDLLKDTHYSKITVSDIIRNAEISRTTFYRHYADIFDMHTKIADKLALSIIEKCVGYVITASDEREYFDEILSVFNSQEEYILLISGENGSRYFFEAMLRTAEKFITDIGSVFTDDMIFRLRFMTVAMIGVYVRDILENRPHNPDYIEICKKLINSDNAFGGQYADRS